jgi:hypothetical protein
MKTEAAINGLRILPSLHPVEEVLRRVQALAQAAAAQDP